MLKISDYNFSFTTLTHENAEQNKDLYNDLYKLWQNVWNKTFTELGENKTVAGDEFFLLDELFTVHIDNKAVAMVAAKWLNLELSPCTDNYYFKTFPPETRSALEAHNIKKFMGLGNLVTHPEWRKQKTGIPFADIVTGLSFKRQIEHGFDSALCYTRNDRSVNKMVKGFGGISLWQGIKRHNVEVDIMIVQSQNVVSHPSSDVQAFIDKLWGNRSNKHQPFKLAV